MTVQVTIVTEPDYIQSSHSCKPSPVSLSLSLSFTSVTAASVWSGGGGGLVKCQPLQACQPSARLVGLMSVKELVPVCTI